MFVAIKPSTTTWGEPNKRTGKYTLHTDIHAFTKKSARDAFVKERTGWIPVDKKAFRKYNLGETVEEYNRYWEFIVADMEG